MALARVWKTLDVILARAAGVIHGFGSGVLAVLMVFTFVDVALRYFFDSPIKGDNDLSAYMMVLVIPAGLAFTALKKKHIRVDVFTQLLPKRVQLWLTTFAHLATLGLVFFMVWQTAMYASSLRASGQTSTALPIPDFPFVIVCAIYLVVFALVVLRELIFSVVHAVRGTEKGGTDVPS